MIVAPRQWPGETVVCIGSGPSLRREDVEACRGRARVIAVNDAYQLAPWADILYACDASWWLQSQAAERFDGPKYSINHSSWTPYLERFPQITRLKNTGVHGLELSPAGLRNGRNSGYQAVNLAVHFGAARIVLLGYDMQARKGQPAHFFGDHRGPRSPYATFVAAFDTLTAPLREIGVTVVNATRDTALTCFPRLPLARALHVEVAA